MDIYGHIWHLVLSTVKPDTNLLESSPPLLTTGSDTQLCSSQIQIHGLSWREPRNQCQNNRSLGGDGGSGGGVGGRGSGHMVLSPVEIQVTEMIRFV